MIRNEKFLEKLKELLESGKSADNILWEISDMKYYEVKELFLAE